MVRKGFEFIVRSPSGKILAEGIQKQGKIGSLKEARQIGRIELQNPNVPIGSRLEIRSATGKSKKSFPTFAEMFQSKRGLI